VAPARFDGDSLGQRDPELIAQLLPTLLAYSRHYVRLRVEGLQHLVREPALLVGNHNGGMAGPDLPATLATLWDALGCSAPLYALAHDFAMRQFTPLGRLLQPFGAVRASPSNARRIIDAGGLALVYPGGDVEAYRHFSKRDRIELEGRRGFVRIARELGAPIQPLVVQGAHRSALIVAEGRAVAKLLALHDWARLERFPVALCLPWGVAVGPWLPYLPLPFPLKLRILPPTFVGAAESDEDAQRRIAGSMHDALRDLARS
jgi:1-acyl-sn-glycerol-3-phosphate acyltransferase